MKEFGEYVELAEGALARAGRFAGGTEASALSAQAMAKAAEGYIELAKLALEIEMES